MNLSNLVNIQNINIEKNIQEVINKSHNKFNGLITEQTCLIWSSMIYEELKKLHVPVYLLSTNEIENAYTHYFTIIPYESDYYVIDLTFRQFKNGLFPDLSIFGYELLSRDEQIKYLEIVSQKKNLNCSFDDILFKNSNKTINRS